MSETKYHDDEYITKDNDPYNVEKITQEDYSFAEDEEIIEDHEEAVASVDTKNFNLSDHDHIQNDKVLDALKSGIFRK